MRLAFDFTKDSPLQVAADMAYFRIERVASLGKRFPTGVSSAIVSTIRVMSGLANISRYLYLSIQTAIKSLDIKLKNVFDEKGKSIDDTRISATEGHNIDNSDIVKIRESNNGGPDVIGDSTDKPEIVINLVSRVEELTKETKRCQQIFQIRGKQNDDAADDNEGRLGGSEGVDVVEDSLPDEDGGDLSWPRAISEASDVLQHLMKATDYEAEELTSRIRDAQLLLGKNSIFSW